MPYSSNSELPKAVRQTVPEDKHTQFRTVFNSVYEDTESEQRAFRAAWSAVEKAGEEVDKSVMDTLRDKANTFNEKYGEKHGRVSASKLKQVYDRGIGAYKTNPGSVRPNVKSKEQWAYARVNSFLDIVRGKKSPKHDKDLLPETKKFFDGEQTFLVSCGFDGKEWGFDIKASDWEDAENKVMSMRETLKVDGVAKAQYASDIFTTEMEARARSIDMGLGGSIHVHEYDGQAVYMPGESHEDYLEHYRPEGEEPKEDGGVDRLDALRAIVNEVMKYDFGKAEYDGREVELNKPFRLPSGSSKKFGVYVKDGDKTKKVTFGSPDMEIRRDDPEARANFRARHNCDTATDKTSARYWSCRMWQEDISVSEMTKQHMDIEGQILKADEEQRMVWGWASVVTEKGEPVVDRQGDVIEPETLVKAVNKFMQHVRVGKQMHDGEQIGMVIHSMPITKEIGDSLGIQSDREGWVVAFKVFDDDVWAKVKSGELAAFSIGGRAIKEDYNG